MKTLISKDRKDRCNTAVCFEQDCRLREHKLPLEQWGKKESEQGQSWIYGPVDIVGPEAALAYRCET